MIDLLWGAGKLFFVREDVYRNGASGRSGIVIED